MIRRVEHTLWLWTLEPALSVAQRHGKHTTIAESGPAYGEAPAQAAVRWMWILAALVAIAFVIWLVRLYARRRT